MCGNVRLLATVQGPASTPESDPASTPALDPASAPPPAAVEPLPQPMSIPRRESEASFIATRPPLESGGHFRASLARIAGDAGQYAHPQGCQLAALGRLMGSPNCP